MWRSPTRDAAAPLALILAASLLASALPAAGIVLAGVPGPSVAAAPSPAPARTSPYAIFNFKNADSPAVDPNTGLVYVADDYFGRTTIYDPANASILGFIDGVSGPMVLDPATGTIVALQGDGAVFVNVTTDQIVATAAGLAPGGWRHPAIALDPRDGLVYAAYNFDGGSTGITLGSTMHVLDLRLRAEVAKIEGLWWSTGIAYDPANGKLYADNIIGGITAIDGRTSSVVGSLTGLDGPNQIAYNPADGELYVPCFNGRFGTGQGGGGIQWTASLTVIDPAAPSIVAVNTQFHAGWDGPEYAVADPVTGHVFVANGTAIVEVADAGSTIVWSLGGLSYPGPLAYDPVHHHLIAAAGDGILDIDLATHAVTSVGNGYARPYAVAYDSSRNRIYVANFNSGAISVIDGRTDRLVGNFSGFGEPVSLTYVARMDELYIGAGYGFSVFDLASETMVATIRDVNPWDVAYDDVSGTLFTTTNTSLVAVRTASRTILANITPSRYSMSLAVDSEGGRLFASNGTNFVVIRISDLTVLSTRMLPEADIIRMAYDPVRDRVYSIEWGSDVVAIDPSTGAIVATVSGPTFPTDLLYNPANGYVYVADQGGTWQLWVIDPGTNQVLTTISLPDEPNLMTYDAANQQIYVAMGGPFGSTGVVSAVPSITYAAPVPAILLWAAGLLALALVVAAAVYFRRRSKGKTIHWEAPR